MNPDGALRLVCAHQAPDVLFFISYIPHLNPPLPGVPLDAEGMLVCLAGFETGSGADRVGEVKVCWVMGKDSGGVTGLESERL